MSSCYVCLGLAAAVLAGCVHSRSPAVVDLSAPIRQWRAMVVEDNAQQTAQSLAGLRAVSKRLRLLSATFRAELEEQLIALLRGERHPAVRREGSALLGEISRGKAVPLLIEQLADQDKVLARAAHRALGLITGEDFYTASEPDLELAREWQRRNPAFVKTCTGIWSGEHWESCVPLDPRQTFERLSCQTKPAAVSLPGERPRLSRCDPPALGRLRGQIARFRMSTGGARVVALDQVADLGPYCAESQAFLEQVLLDARQPDAVRLAAEQRVSRNSPPLVSRALASEDPLALTFALDNLYYFKVRTRPAMPVLRHRLLWLAKCHPAVQIRARAADNLALSFCHQVGVEAFLAAALAATRQPPLADLLADSLTRSVGCPHLSFPTAEALLGHPAASVRALLLEHLFHLDARRALPHLLRAAAGQDKEPQRAAIGALATREGRRLAPSFMPRLLRGELDEGALIAVITAAGESHLLDQVPWLLQMARHQSPRVAGAAAEVLGGFPERAAAIIAVLEKLQGSTAVAEVLLQQDLLGNPTTSITLGSKAEFSVGRLRDAAARSLATARLTEQSCLTSCRCLFDGLTAAESGGTLTEPGLLARSLTRCPHYFYSFALRRGAGLLGERDLERLLASPRWYDQEVAVRLLGQLGTRHARAAVRSRYDSLQLEGRIAALHAFGADETDRAGSLLRQALSDARPAVKAAAAASLLAKGIGQALPALLAAFRQSRSQALRAEVSLGFGRCQDFPCLKAGAKLYRQEAHPLVKKALGKALEASQTRLKKAVATGYHPDLFIGVPSPQWVGEHAEEFFADRRRLLDAVCQAGDATFRQALCRLPRLPELLQSLELAGDARRAIASTLDCGAVTP